MSPIRFETDQVPGDMELRGKIKKGPDTLLGAKNFARGGAGDFQPVSGSHLVGEGEWVSLYAVGELGEDAKDKKGKLSGDVDGSGDEVFGSTFGGRIVNGVEEHDLEVGQSWQNPVTKVVYIGE